MVEYDLTAISDDELVVLVTLLERLYRSCLDWSPTLKGEPALAAFAHRPIDSVYVSFY